MTNNKRDDLVDLRRERDLRLEDENFSSESENNESENVGVNVSKTSPNPLPGKEGKSKTSPNPSLVRRGKSFNLSLVRRGKSFDSSLVRRGKFLTFLLSKGKMLSPLSLLYLLAFLLPLFVLPQSMEIYEFNKILLLFVFSGLAFLLWLAKMILVDKKIEIIKTPLDLPIVIFISIILISTAFSVDKISSVLGFYGRFSDSLMVYLSLAMVYFVGVNCLKPNPNPSQEGNLECRRGALPLGDEAAERVIEQSLPRTAEGHSPTATLGSGIISAFLASSFIVVIASLIYSFGFKFIPWDEAGFRSFNFVGGSLNILAIYLTAVILIALGRRSAAANILSKHLMSILIIASLILLILIDFVLAWIVLAICLVLVLGLAGARKLIFRNLPSSPLEKGARGISSIIFSSLIILISITFVATSLTALNDNVQSDLQSSLISSSVKNRLISSNNNQAARDGFTREISLDRKTASSIAMAGLNNVKSDPISVVIGSGPGTYLYNFAKFKPSEFNNSVFWNLRFDKAGSEILEKVSTIGVLGTLSYLAIIVLVMGMFLKMILKRRQDAAAGLSPTAAGTAAINLYLFAAWFGLLLFQFLYLESTAIKFIFWLLTVVLAAGRCWTPLKVSNTFTLNLKKEPSAFYSSLAALAIITAAFGYSYYHQINFYQADAIYKKAQARQNEALRNADLTPQLAWKVLDQGVGDMERAVEKNPQRGEYKIYLSDIHLNRANLVFQEESEKSEEEKNNARIAEEVKNAIDYAKSAADASPNNIIFQQKLAIVYAALSKNMGVVGADEWAIKNYQKAIELEPTNPVLRGELGKICAAADKMDLAVSELEKALELKENYLDAGLQLGLAYEKQEDNQKAIKRLSSLGSVERIDDFIAAGQTINLNSSSIDIDIAFQLGRIYYNEGEISWAKSIFLKITKANPTHSNAHYSLGLIYEKDGDDEMALKEFEIVLAANPGNEEVKKKVDKLRGTGGEKIIESEEE